MSRSGPGHLSSRYIDVLHRPPGERSAQDLDMLASRLQGLLKLGMYPPKAQTMLARIAKVVEPAPGDFIVRQGDTCGAFYFIARGSVAMITRATFHGEETQTGSTVFNGSSFGFDCLLDRSTERWMPDPPPLVWKSSYIANEQCQLLCISKVDFRPIQAIAEAHQLELRRDVRVILAFRANA